jgi:hypothetical protein
MAMIVTGFYNLEKFEERRTPTAEWAVRSSWLLGHAGVSMVVYADDDFIERTAFRRILTVPVIAPDFSDIDRITQNLQHSRIGWDPLKDTPRYFCLMRHRISWMVDAASQVNADAVLTWADLCLPHREGETLHEVLARPPEPGKIRLSEISYVPRSARYSVDRYYERHWWPVGGGLWSARPAEIRWLAAEMEKEWELSLDLGYVATDEMLIGRVLFRHPERFETYYGDHPSLAENWRRVRGSQALILDMAVRALEDGNLEEGLRRCRALRSSY